MSPMWGAREEVTNEKPRLRKCGLLVVCPYGLYVTYVGGKGGSNKRKNHVFESAVFSWFAHTGVYVTYVGAREEVTSGKTTF